MEQSHLHQLFKQISSKLNCPKCNHKIPPQKIQIVFSLKNVCQFEAICDQCGNTAGISAIVESEITTDGKKLNASTRIEKSNKYIDTPIKEKEIQSIRTLSNKFSSFKLLFRNK